MAANDVFETEFLPTRAKILEIAAALDRIDRAGEEDPRRSQLRAGLEILLADDADRAEQIQLLFSRPYEDNWQETFGLRK